jgi:hypothetical protein
VERRFDVIGIEHDHAFGSDDRLVELPHGHDLDREAILERRSANALRLSGRREFR